MFIFYKHGQRKKGTSFCFYNIVRFNIVLLLKLCVDILFSVNWYH